MPLNITKGRIIQASKVILYGPEGIGKTSLAACFPGVVFIDTEGSTKSFDVSRLPAPTSWEMLKAEVQEVLDHAGEVGTLCIDTADWAEKLCSQAVCKKGGKTGIEDFGYGKGYVYMAEEFGRLLDLCSQLTDRGVNVVFTAHTQQRRVELPDQMDSYDKYELKCSKQVSPLLKEWADAVLFCNYKTFIVQNESGKGKAQGGERRMYASHRPAFDAKNRFNLPDEMPMDFGQIAHLFPQGQAPALPEDVTPAPPPEPVHTAVSPANPTQPMDAQQSVQTQTNGTEDAGAVSGMPAPAPAVSAAQEPEAQAREQDEVDPFTGMPLYEGIYPPLVDLMRQHNVTPTEIMIVVGDKGYFPSDMPVKDYPLDFVQGCLVAAWDSVYQCIKEDREGIPF